MAHFPLCFFKGLLALQISVVLIVGSLDSANSLPSQPDSLPVPKVPIPPPPPRTVPKVPIPPPPRRTVPKVPIPPPPPRTVPKVPIPPPPRRTVPKFPITPPPPRKFPPIAVEGLVYCKPCKFRGVETLLDASPLAGAVVKVQCILNKRTYYITGTTDKNGYYFIQPKRMIRYPVHQCKVFLVSSPSKNCSVPTNLNKGLSGASLEFRTLLPGTTPVALNSVWPLAFEPPANAKCHL